jgi:hypothetical protein
MNSTQFFDSTNFVSGIFELDGDGTVLYSRFKSRSQLADLTNHLNGQNFFEDFFKFENAEDFQHKFKYFVSSHQFTDNFIFDCQTTGKTVPVRVMLLRASEVSNQESRDILIVDIRKNVV